MTNDPTAPAVEPHERSRRRFIAVGATILLVAVLLAGLELVRLGANHWSPFGSDVGRHVRADDPTAPVPVALDAAVIAEVGQLTGHWDGTGRWGLRSPSGDLTASIRSIRIADDDPAADYYVAQVATTWTHGSGTPHLPDPVEITVTSDVDPLDHVFGATDSFVSDAGCQDRVSLPMTVGALDGGAAQACSGYGVELVAMQPTTATWRAVQPEGLRSVDLEFSQKVAQGEVPRWSVTVVAQDGTVILPTER